MRRPARAGRARAIQTSRLRARQLGEWKGNGIGPANISHDLVTEEILDLWPQRHSQCPVLRVFFGRAERGSGENRCGAESLWTLDQRTPGALTKS